MPAPTFPLQQGSQHALQVVSPTFPNVVLIDETWQEKDNVVMKDYKDGASKTQLTIFADPGVDAQCRWIVNSGQAPYVKGQSITATTDTVTTPRTFLIVDVDNGKYGGFAVEQTVKLRYKVAQTLS